MKFSMRICYFLLSSVLIVFSNSAFAAGKNCALPGEKAALDIKALQSHLMVAALSCGERERYNWFVKRFGSTLAAGGDDLRGYFERAYGAASETKLNQFVTSVANRASKQSISIPLEEFCGEVSTVFDELATAGAGDIAYLRNSGAIAKLHGVRTCSASEEEMINSARVQEQQ